MKIQIYDCHVLFSNLLYLSLVSLNLAILIQHLLFLQSVNFKAGNRLLFNFHSDGSNNEWGYKFTVSLESCLAPADKIRNYRRFGTVILITARKAA